MNITDLLYPLADVARMKLKYDGKKGTLSGTRKMKIKIAPGVGFDTQPTVVSSFINKGSRNSGMLLHIKGHLYLMVGYSDSTRTVTAWIVSSQSLGIKRIDTLGIIDKVKSIKEAMNILRGGIKESFFKNVLATEWKTVALPKQ